MQRASAEEHPAPAASPFFWQQLAGQAALLPYSTRTAPGVTAKNSHSSVERRGCAVSRPDRGVPGVPCSSDGRSQIWSVLASAGRKALLLNVQVCSFLEERYQIPVTRYACLEL